MRVFRLPGKRPLAENRKRRTPGVCKKRGNFIIGSARYIRRNPSQHLMCRTRRRCGRYTAEAIASRQWDLLHTSMRSRAIWLIKPVMLSQGFKEAIMFIVKLVVVLAFVVVASPSFAQSDNAQSDNRISTTRAQAIHDCNIQVSKYFQHLWGKWENDIYRACMAQHGQRE
jgi:hypothetical protein